VDGLALVDEIAARGELAGSYLLPSPAWRGLHCSVSIPRCGGVTRSAPPPRQGSERGFQTDQADELMMPSAVVVQAAERAMAQRGRV